MIVSETYYEGLRDVLRRSQRRTTKVSETYYEGLRDVLRRSQRRATRRLLVVFVVRPGDVSRRRLPVFPGSTN